MDTCILLGNGSIQLNVAIILLIHLVLHSLIASHSLICVTPHNTVLPSLDLSVQNQHDGVLLYCHIIETYFMVSEVLKVLKPATMVT